MINKRGEELTKNLKVGDKALPSSQELQRQIAEDEQVAFWIKAREHVEGYAEDGIQNWQYILIESAIVRFFIHCFFDDTVASCLLFFYASFSFIHFFIIQ